MCVIIIKTETDTVIENHILRASARINPHGLGVTWLDNMKTEYMNSSKYEVLSTKRPFIAHFRYATVGGVTQHNMHPFPCGKQDHELLMMNGTIRGLGNKKDCDSRVLAGMLGELDRSDWKNTLEEHDCRFVTINTEKPSFEIYNREMWHEHEGVLYSKANVLYRHTIAVYGTLKKGQGNHENYLSKAEFLGAGITQDKYPLIIPGLPYLMPMQGQGHRVEMHVFRVTDEMLADVDQLENHPTWYYRKRVPVHVGDTTYHAWTYFNECQGHKPTEAEMHSSYPAPSGGGSNPHLKMADADELLPFFDEETEQRLSDGKYCLECYSDVKPIEESEGGVVEFECTTCRSTFLDYQLDQYKLF